MLAAKSTEQITCWTDKEIKIGIKYTHTLSLFLSLSLLIK